MKGTYIPLSLPLFFCLVQLSEAVMATFTIPFSSCSAAIIPFPTLYGAQILSLSATPLTNFSTVPTINPSSAPPFNGSAVCNITVTYTHPGENDTINVKAWLPFQNYNDRLQSIGGSGWTTGRGPVSYTFMEAAILEGYATSTTDAGFGMTYSLTGDPSSWALLSPGNVNIYALQDLASVSLNDQAIIAKDLARSFYGQAPRYAYWYGGSQGGRQGYMLAQRYPDAYHGILAALPAINWGQVLVSALWPALFMEWTGQFPHSCELDYITNSSVAACDGKDGVMDGISVNPDMCDFTPFDLVGKSFNCLQEGTMMKVSNAAASVANATFAGPRSTKGESLWYGPNFGTDLTGDTYGAGFGTAATTCSSNGTCVPVINNLYASWIPLFMERNPSFNQLNLTHEEYDYIFHAAVQQYDSIINTDDPGLSEFRDKGRKMLTYHGLVSLLYLSGIVLKRTNNSIIDRRPHPHERDTALLRRCHSPHARCSRLLSLL